MKKLLVLMALSLFIVIGMAYAAPQLTINTATWGQTSKINISTKDANDGSLVNMSNVAVRCSSASTANSSTRVIYNITNSTATNANLGYVNFTFGDDLILEDSNDYSCTAISTGVGAADAVTSSALTVLVDRTAPTAASAVTFANPIADAGTVTATLTDANTIACFIRFGSPAAPRLAMTISGTTCTFTVGRNNPSNGAYQAFIETHDNTNATLTSAQNIEILAVLSDGGGLFSGAQVQLPANQGLQGALGGSSNPFAPKQGLQQLLSNPIVLIIIGITAYLLLSKKK